MTQDLLIGIDVGYGQVKARSLDGRELCIPSWTARVHDKTMAMGNIQIVNDNGDMWLVGEDAHRLAKASVPQVDSSWFEQDEYRVLFRYALSHFGVRSARIVTGLPIRHLKTHKERLVNTFKSWKSMGLNVEPVRVVAQPVGSLWEVAFDDKGAKPVDPGFRGRVGIVDIGNGTIDAIEANELHVSLTNHACDPKGVSRAYDYVLSYIRAKGIQARITDMPKVIAAGTIRDGASLLPLDKPIAEAKRLIVQAAADIISEMWTNPQSLDWLIFTGGGAAFVETELKQEFRKARVSIPANPHMANVRGYLKIGQIPTAKKKD